MNGLDSPVAPPPPGIILWWRDELRRHPILVGWLIIFVVHAGMNAKLGHEIGGGEGPGALLYAAAFLGFACVGAWAADKLLVERVRSGRGMLVTLVVLQVAIGQMAGYQSFGLTLAKGAGDLEAKATSRRTTQEALEDARAEVKKIGTTRVIGSIRADEQLECTIKGKAYKDGVGPKCTALRNELATAERREKLQGDIVRLTAALRDGPAIKDGNALYDVPMGLANAVVGGVTGRPGKVGPDDVRFVWLVLLVFALEIFGTFGLALVRLMDGPDGGPRRGGRLPAGESPRPGTTPPRGGTFRDAVDAVVGALPAPAPMLALTGPSDAHFASGPGQMTTPYIAKPTHVAPQMHGAPINITINGSGAERVGSLAGAPGADTAPVPAALRVAPQSAASRRDPRLDLDSLPADAPPVDRSAVSRELSPAEREAADVILAFAAACLVASPGGIVDAGNIHRRYARWAGARALDEAPFLALLADVTPHRAEDIGGSLHVRGVALRAGTRLEAVA